MDDELVSADKVIDNETFSKQHCKENCNGRCSNNLKGGGKSCEGLNTSNNGLTNFEKEGDEIEQEDRLAMQECTSNIENLTHTSESAMKTTYSEGSDIAQKTIIKKNLSISNFDNLEHSSKFEDSKGDEHIAIGKKTHSDTFTSKTLLPYATDAPETASTDGQFQQKFQNLNTGTSGSAVLPSEKCEHFSKPHSSGNLNPNSQNNVKPNDENHERTHDSANLMDIPLNSHINATAPVSHPIGPIKRKQSSEMFHVKTVQPNESSTSCSSFKTKIRPILGHVRVTAMLKENGPFPIIFFGAPNISDMKAYVKETNCEASKTVPEISECTSKPVDLDSESLKISNGEHQIPDAVKKLGRVNGDRGDDNHSCIADNDSTQSHFAPSSENQPVAVPSGIRDKFQQLSGLESPNVNTVSRDNEYDLKKAMDGFFKEQEDENNSTHKSSYGFASLDDIALNPHPSMVRSNNSVVSHSLSNPFGGSYASPYNVFSDLSYNPWINNSRRNVPKPVRYMNHINQFNKPPDNMTSGSFTKHVYVVPLTSKPQNFNNFNRKHAVLKQRHLPPLVAKPSTIISTVKVSNLCAGNGLSTSSLKVPFPKKSPKEATGSSSSCRGTKLAPSTTTKMISHAPLAPSFPKAMKRKTESLNHQGSSENAAKKMHLNLDIKSSEVLNCTTESNVSESNPDPLNTNDIPTNPKKPGVLVKFEDGVRLWIDKLRDLMYLDDERVKSWKLTTGTEVAAKYTDGLFYDAIILSTYDGKTFVHFNKKEKKLVKPVLKDKAATVPPNRLSNLQVPEVTKNNMPTSNNTVSSNSPSKRKHINRPPISKNESKAATLENKKKINSAVSPQVRIEKLELHKIPNAPNSRGLKKEGELPANSPAPSDDLPDSDNPMLKIKCPNCFLVFKNVSLFQIHQKTVCGSNGVPVTGFHFEPNVVVKVDEKGVPPFVTSQPKTTNDDTGKMKLIPRAPDGRRCFRRGTRILHRWQTDKGSRWFNGKILRLLETNKGARCEFEVEYTDDDHDTGPYAVCLYEDYPHDIRIVTR